MVFAMSDIDWNQLRHMTPIHNAMAALLNNEVLDAEQVSLIRTYLSYLLNFEPDSPTVNGLRVQIAYLRTAQDILVWIEKAKQLGYDPT